jgi:hypothetical protein
VRFTSCSVGRLGGSAGLTSDFLGPSRSSIFCSSSLSMFPIWLLNKICRKPWWMNLKGYEWFADRFPYAPCLQAAEQYRGGLPRPERFNAFWQYLQTRGLFVKRFITLRK